MSDRSPSRRRFLKDASLLTGAMLLGTQASSSAESSPSKKLHVACNQYPWITYYRREGRDFNAEIDTALGELAAAGLDGFEPLVTSPGQIDQLAPLLKKHGLEMRSLYVNSLLHEKDQAQQSIDSALAIAEKAKAIGTKIVVTNPSPIQWGGTDDKTDEQLIFQAKALERLGRQLHELGLTLSYHNHDMELRNAAREFHHMMVATDPKYVTFCLDAHWIYRGSGNSSVALFDVLKLYSPRITELHLRQSTNNTWSETFSAGDIDYPALAAYLLKINIRPLLVLEQAVENGTPKTLSPEEAHRQSNAYAREVFAGMG